MTEPKPIPYAALWSKEDRIKEWRENGDMFHSKEILLDDRDDIKYLFFVKEDPDIIRF